MNIVVLLKQVPETSQNLKLSKEGLDESQVKWVINPYDEFALEEALQLKPKFKGKVFCLSLGPQRTKESLLQALAMGADEAFHLEGFLQNPLKVAGLLAKKISSLPSLSLILCGKQSADTNDFAVPQMLASFLKWPFATNINSLEWENEKFVLKRECGAGVIEEFSTTSPLVISVDKGINQPRYPSLAGIMQAKKKPCEVTATNENLWEMKLSPQKEKEAPEMIPGTPEEQVKKLIQLLRDKEKLL